MGRRLTDEGRRKRGRGQGEGADYDPWIHAGQKEFRNRGTSTRLTDDIIGRRVHTLSRGETGWWYEMRWRDDVADIREQKDLNLEDTVRIAESLGYKHPQRNGKPVVMTTDMLVTFTDGTMCAYSIKTDRGAFDRPRTVEKHAIERCYWQEKGVGFKTAFGEDLNRIRTRNIQDVLEMYSSENVCDEIGVLRHLIAHKKILTDMDSAPLDYVTLKKQYKKEIEEWLKKNSQLLEV